MKNTKKLFAGSMVALSLVFIFPQNAGAYYGIVNDPIHTTVGAGSAVSTGITAGKSIADTIKAAADIIARAAIRLAIRKLTNATVAWINNGFQGNPGFVTDPRQFFLDVGDNAISQYLSQTGPLNALCTPFKSQVRLALVKNYLSDTNPNYSCTLSILKNNFEAYTQDFTQGGWEGWFEMTQVSQNNPYGAYLDARSGLNRSLDSNVKKFTDQLSQGNGFLSFQRCKPGTALTAGEIASLEATIGSTGMQAGDCLESDKENATPGKVIETQLEGALGTGLKQLELARSADEIFSALIVQLFTRVLQSGKGLLDRNDPNDTNNTIPIPETPNNRPTITLLGRTPIYLQLNSSTEYRDAGAVAYDPTDGDITDRIVRTGDIDPTTPGTYTITYTVTNSLGISASVVLTVIVVDDAIDPPEKDDPVPVIIVDGGPNSCGPGTVDPGLEPASLQGDVAIARAKFGTITSTSQLSAILEEVAIKNTAAGWGLLSKPSGTNCPHSSGSISCDILFHAPSCLHYDVLFSAGVGEVTSPTWLFAGTMTRSRFVDVGGGGGGNSTLTCVPVTPPANCTNTTTCTLPQILINGICVNPTGGGSAPTLSSISPNPAAAGTTITITGNNLTSTTVNFSVLFFEASGARWSAPIISGSATQVTALLPAGFAGGSATVRVGNVSANVLSNSLSFSVTGGGTVGVTITTVTPISSWSPTLNNGDGWWPQISPSGQHVTYGNARTYIAEPSTNTQIDITPAGESRCWGGYWIQPTTITFVCDVGNGTFHRYEASLANNWNPVLTSDNPGLVAGNSFKATDGHWASFLAGGGRLVRDGVTIANGVGGGLSMSGDQMVTACNNNNNTICVWQGGNLLKTLPTLVPNNGMVLGGGYIVYGGSGTTLHGINPSGTDINLKLSPSVNEGANDIVFVNGQPWVVTNAWTGSGVNEKGYILLRPWGDSAVIAISAQFGGNASVTVSGNNFVIAWQNDTGGMAVQTVPINSARSTLPQ